MSKFSLCCATTLAILLPACASVPTGPSVMVLPGAGQSFDQFRADDAVCQQFAMFQIGGTPNNAALESGVTSAVVGTALGAAAGAAFGGGTGAAIGAGAGLAGGGLVGSSYASSSRTLSQQHFDVAYIQCMYAKGHQVPVSGQFSNVIPRQSTSVPAAVTTSPPANIPPPPPGLPPPPPPAGTSLSQ